MKAFHDSLTKMLGRSGFLSSNAFKERCSPYGFANTDATRVALTILVAISALLLPVILCRHRAGRGHCNQHPADPRSLQASSYLVGVHHPQRCCRVHRQAARGGTYPAGMASRHGGADPGGGERRPGDTGAHRRPAGVDRNHVREFNPTRKDPHWAGANSTGISHDRFCLCQHQQASRRR
jgi:hypothetical protein